MYRNSESLFRALELTKCCRSIILQETKKLIEKEIRFVVTRGKGLGEWKVDKVVKRYKLPVTS